MPDVNEAMGAKAGSRDKVRAYRARKPSHAFSAEARRQAEAVEASAFAADDQAFVDSVSRFGEEGEEA